MGSRCILVHHWFSDCSVKMLHSPLTKRQDIVNNLDIRQLWGKNKFFLKMWYMYLILGCYLLKGSEVLFHFPVFHIMLHSKTDQFKIFIALPPVFWLLFTLRVKLYWRDTQDAILIWFIIKTKVAFFSLFAMFNWMLLCYKVYFPTDENGNLLDYDIAKVSSVITANMKV